MEDLENVDSLDNFVQYFYDDTEYLWDFMLDGIIAVDDPNRISEHLQLRRKEVDNDLAVMLERGQAVPEDAALITGTSDFEKIYQQKEVYLLMPFTAAVSGVSALTELRAVSATRTGSTTWPSSTVKFTSDGKA